MFVAVEMSWGDARAANLLDLGVPLALDFAGFQATAGDAEEQAFGTAVQFARGVEQAAHVFRFGGGRAIAEVQVDADAECGIGARHFQGRIKGAAIGKQGSAGHQALAVGLGNAAVDAFGPAEVIGVNDKILQMLRFSCT